ncbi:S9 family peptidase [Thermoplasma sp. Kam2015]|uniref:alpha/beta hydrolase family protein n=1 Tax=Thermoplasma sp. Kam2015 TaxID=2094122 RepID=UPI000D8D287D|nr:S9 family peptidase [Thermoplasma sp. Kam2015]PYB68429.1 S9 family peptidase [Thermoplasma sp. Kam2015]
MDPMQAYKVRFANDIFIDGDWVYFTEKYIRNDEYHSIIKRMDRSGNIVQVTFGENERYPKIYGNSLFYIKYTKEKESLMRVDNLSEAKEIASFAKISDYVLIGKDIYVIAQEPTDNTLPFEAHDIKYRFNARGLLRSYNALYRIREKPEKIYSGNFDVTGIRSNGGRIVISTTENSNDYGLTDLFEIDAEGKKLKRITKDSADINDFAISDSGRIAFSGYYGLDVGRVSNIVFPEEDLEISVGKDAYNSVIGDSFGGSHYRILFYGNKIYAIGQDRSSSFVYEVGDEVRRITPEERNIVDFDFRGSLAYIYSDMVHPSVVSFDSEYDLNPDIRGIKAQSFDMDGGECFAMVASKDAPSILFIHGGPHTAYGHTYFIEFQYFFSNGYNILFCNPPGSTGYGQEYEKACIGDWGGKDLQYIEKFVKECRIKYGLTGKIGVTGGSYGGYMTNWIVTQTNEFACAISERSISNLFSMIGTSDIGFWFNTLELDLKDPYSSEGMQKLMEFSPINYVKKVKTPTMLITGEEDYRCPIEQAEQFYVALKLNNVDASLVRYPGDNHEHARSGVPKNMLDRLKRKTEWFDRYLKKEN